MAFDPAASCGWCVLDNGAYFDGGTEVFSYPTAKRAKAGDPRGLKWLNASNWIVQTIETLRPDYIFVEDVKRHAGTLAAHQFGFYFHMIETMAAVVRARFVPIGVPVWKSELGVGGGADKDAVLGAMEQHFAGVRFVTHDHSDAAAMAFVGNRLIVQGRLFELEGKSKRKRVK